MIACAFLVSSCFFCDKNMYRHENAKAATDTKKLKK